MAEPVGRPNRVVVCLGGNALGSTPEELQHCIAETTPALLRLIDLGNEIIITHGNGPQVGWMQKAFAIAHMADPEIPDLPLPDCGAVTQGYIGYYLQQGLENEIRREGKPWHVATVITQIEVDKDDPSFKHPVKPIGEFYTEDQADMARLLDPSLIFMEDSGRGYRRAVASPMPLRIIETPSIMNLLDSGYIVLACGGGGIPVVEDEHGLLHGVNAVLDKDLGGEILAEECDADVLFLLTQVNHVSINFGKPDQIDLSDLSVADAKRYLAEGQFGKGSMEPKVEAAVRFAESKPGRVAIIGALERAPEIMRGQSGTHIHL